MDAVVIPEAAKAPGLWRFCCSNIRGTTVLLSRGFEPLALAVQDGDIALGDALGRIHVFEAQEFLCQKGNPP